MGVFEEFSPGSGFLSCGFVDCVGGVFECFLEGVSLADAGGVSFSVSVGDYELVGIGVFVDFGFHCLWLSFHFEGVFEFGEHGLISYFILWGMLL